MTVYAITDSKKGRTGIAPTYLQTTRLMPVKLEWLCYGMVKQEGQQLSLTAAAAAEFICQVKNTHVHIKCKR